MSGRERQQQGRRPPQREQSKEPQKKPQQTTVKKASGFSHPSLNLASFFEPAPLSPHPDVDRYLPKVLVGSVIAVTGIMSLIELAQLYWLPSFDSDIDDSDDPNAASSPTPQFSKKVIVHDKPIPVENWPRNVEGKLIFQPTYEWQEVPQDCVCPAGLEYQLDTQTGRRLGRAIRKK